MAEILMGDRPQYTGQKQPRPEERDAKGRPRRAYFPSPELVEAVNLALYLERPLLLKGEPGCGKTQLAHAVAYELGLPLKTWAIKSTSHAQDGLYTYDAVGRLRDAQMSQMLPPEEQAAVKLPHTYIQFGPLGHAFQDAQQTVVLIDEIDKADLDFPNDLLMELDEGQFTVPELSQEPIVAQKRPLVIITSNDEKDLPDAFLRRCLFHYLEFPDLDRLRRILRATFADIDPEVLTQALDRFQTLRRQMERQAGKKVSTSELIDWVKVLHSQPKDEVLAKLQGQLPYAGVLLKRWEDHRRYLSNE
ncbi:MAG: MoxR family ATPase [Cyanobacteria bacterium P01_G01_bin.54]